MDLKAELYRKQEQFKRQKLGQETSGAGFKAKSKDKVQHEWFLNVFFYNGVQWLTHVSNFPLHMFLCRSPTSGINKMRVFQQELLKMQSSWKRSGAPSIQQGEFSTAEVFLYNRWTKTSHSFFFYSLDRRKLEEKARLYEQMTKGDFPGWWTVCALCLLQQHQSGHTLYLPCCVTHQMKRRKGCSLLTSPRRLLTKREKHLPRRRKRTRSNSAYHPSLLLRTRMKNGNFTLIAFINIQLVLASYNISILGLYVFQYLLIHYVAKNIHLSVLSGIPFLIHRV